MVQDRGNKTDSSIRGREHYYKEQNLSFDKRHGMDHK